LIDDLGDRREAYNIMLSIPQGTELLVVQRAAREFAQVELTDHKYVIVSRDHQANPLVHRQAVGPTGGDIRRRERLDEAASEVTTAVRDRSTSR
jgi:hypothetical protein